MGPILHSSASSPRSSSSPTSSHLRETYDSFLSLLDPSSSSSQSRSRKTSNATSSSKDVGMMDAAERLKRVRRLVLTEGVPELPSLPPLRPLIWKLLLQVDTHLDTEGYLRLVGKGPSWLNAKIKNDTFRTLATDPTFKSVVSDEMLERLLETFVWRNMGADGAGGGGLEPSTPNYHSHPSTSFPSPPLHPPPISYVQGMNVLSAPLLYVLPSQIEAYECFVRLIEKGMPSYVGAVLGGVHAGLKLLDKCLAAVDEELFLHLKSKSLSAELYAFPSVLTLSACTPPLNEVLKLWDFLLAFGVHLNVLCVIAQMLLMRQELMDSASPMKLLRIFPPLDAQAVIGITVALVKDVPEGLYGELVRHPLAVS